MSDQHFSATMPGSFYAEDVYAPGLVAARAKLRERYGLPRLPRGAKVWVSEPASSWRGDNTTCADSPYSATSGM
jgi:hypothetical protein